MKHCRFVFNFASLGVNAGDDAMNMALVAELHRHGINVCVTSMDVARTRTLLGAEPVIVSSGYSKDPILSNYIEFGFKGVVIKPFQISELSQEIKRVMDL